MPDNVGLTVGIDLGSTHLHVVTMHQDGSILNRRSVPHQGRIREVTWELLRPLAGQIERLAINSRGARLLPIGYDVDDQVAVIAGAQAVQQQTQAILHIGAEKFYLILLDDHRRFRKSITNSGCAAGTGSFLEQQAARLNLASTAELATRALSFRGEPPLIATRCAVFAKTDLVHAQQRGYSLEAICAGVCRGVARNVVEAIRSADELPDPVLLTGGVARNAKIVEELRSLLGRRLIVPEEPQLVPAIGLAHLARMRREACELDALRQFLELGPSPSSALTYAYAPLATVPYRREAVPLHWSGVANDVEIEVYAEPGKGRVLSGYLGIDIGSTSTKAALVDEAGQPLLALYTRTLGQPIAAVQRLFRAMREIERRFGVSLEILACGTTGSGRKLIRHVLNADLAVDEITAHARAACHLRPDVDTIIEIGGQDSKFTVVRNGRVVFSVMNLVCAAGTGSFLEEQAKRLGVDLQAYAEAAEKARAPLTSDRCTVFMERDLNALLHQGYDRTELLAAAIHSVRDNYLSKVADIQKIGNVIVFQGATGKNPALVKAFEQKLGKPVYVSPYCHVAGAIGVALILRERGVRLNPQFRRNIDQLQVTSEEDVCRLCANYCKITRLHLGDESVSWGFLCGRHEDDTGPRSRRKDPNYVRTYRSALRAKPAQRVHASSRKGSFIPLAGADLRRILPIVGPRNEVRPETRRGLRIGIPFTLNYVDTFPIWRDLFDQLGFQVISSTTGPHTVELGRQIAAAEFCAPIAMLHGQVAELAPKVDYLFLPVLFRNGQAAWNKHYCYYSNYVAALLLNNHKLDIEAKTISPVLDLDQPVEQIAEAIQASLPHQLARAIGRREIETALEQALANHNNRLREARAIFARSRATLQGIGVVLLGRPYIVLDDRLNHRIAERLAEWGVPVYYQEMLPLDEPSGPVGEQYREWNHWHYGEWILRAAEFVARDEKLFPIYVTAFRCSPDSFVLPYFRELMDRYDKPYLILQLDDHSGAEGFETRLEAALETFREHRPKRGNPEPIRFEISPRPKRRTYLLPNYDPLSTELIAAAFRRRGLEAIPLEETPQTVRESVRANDGQCLPLSAMLQAIRHTVHKYDLDPEKTGFFINALCELSCNLPQYPLLIKQMLGEMGDGLEKLDVVATGTTFQGLPFPLLVDIYCAYLLGGLLQRLGCKVRPRELPKGETDRVVRAAVQDLAQAFEEGRSKELAFREVVEWFRAIPTDPQRSRLPKVAIIGDLYVRDNHVFNQNLIAELEKEGAEVLTTPYSFIIRLLAIKHFRNLAANRKYANLALDKTLLLSFTYFDRKFHAIAHPLLQEPLPQYGPDLLEKMARYHVHFRHPGETSQNLMKIFHLLEHHPDIRLFVHVNPIFCCPGLVSEAIFRRVEQDIGVPIVHIVYDGTQSDHNQVVRPYLHFLRERADSAGSEREVA